MSLTTSTNKNINIITKLLLLKYLKDSIFVDMIPLKLYSTNIILDNTNITYDNIYITFHDNN